MVPAICAGGSSSTASSRARPAAGRSVSDISRRPARRAARSCCFRAANSEETAASPTTPYPQSADSLAKVLTMAHSPAVTKAIIPVAGLGTRFLPATKAMPKEMLPVVDTPTIHYVVEEAASAGIRDVLLVTGRGKGSIVDYFDSNPALEAALEAKGDDDGLAA